MKKYVVDTEGDKYKAKKVNVLKFVELNFENAMKIPGISKSAVCRHFNVSAKKAEMYLKSEELLIYLIQESTDDRAIARKVISYLDSKRRTPKKFIETLIYDFDFVFQEFLDIGRVDLIPLDIVFKLDWGTKQSDVNRMKHLVHIHGIEKVSKHLLKHL